MQVRDVSEETLNSLKTRAAERGLTPGTVVWVPVTNVKALHDELRAKQYGHACPSIDRDAPGGPTIEIIDPFGNVLRLCQAD